MSDLVSLPMFGFEVFPCLQLKGIVSDSNIFLWHESEDIQLEKFHFQNFSWFQFYVYKLCMIMCTGINFAP